MAYPKIDLPLQHRIRYMNLESRIIDLFVSVLDKDRVIIGEQLSERYDHIWHMDKGTQAQAVLLPKTTEEVSEILKICNENKCKVLIQGGLTNLVGSTETKEDEVVISLEKMNAIIELDEESRAITVEAGVILEDIHSATQNKGLLFPLNFGAKGSAQIGGIISTNAGGLRVLRYGMTRQLIIGLEVVLADGTILSNLKKILKDNSGYDLKQLFIGAEGTLGVITKAVLRLQELPSSRCSALVGFSEYSKVIQFLKFADRELAGTLSGYELIWKDTYKILTSPPSLLKPPMAYDYNYYVLIESMGSDQENDQSKMQELLEQAMESELLEDAMLAGSESDLNWFWNIREDVGIIDAQFPYSQHYDVSIPIPSIGSYVNQVRQQLKEKLNISNAFPFGHVADGNIHFIVGKPNDTAELKKAIDDIIYTPLKNLNGSVSAEHGIGLHKKSRLYISKSKEEISIMKSLKQTLDPNNILGAGRIFD